MIYGSRTWYTMHWSDLKPERNGKVKSINTNTSGTEMNQWTVYLVETYEEPPSSWTATLSANRTATEYYIQQEGDSTGTPVFVASYDAPKSSPNWSESSGKPLEMNQTILSQWYPSWTKSCAHNQLRIKEWEDVTSKEERVVSGAPVAFIDNDEASAEISFSVNVAGTIYVYASANPITYSSLVAGDTVSIQNVTELNTTKTVTLENCPKNSWIRVVYLPSTGVATLNIEKVIAEV